MNDSLAKVSKKMALERRIQVSGLASLGRTAGVKIAVRRRRVGQNQPELLDF
ncbi:MAG: hypothetical protein ABIV07_13670 [Polaromonas sp.]